MTDPTARDLIDRLGMQPHPEGGWYAETWRAPAPDGERATSTAIHFLLEEGQRSHWHTVDAAEIWCHHAGAPVRLRLSADGEAVTDHVLGSDVMAGQEPQVVVPEGHWQAAEATEGWSLVTCAVAPGFTFAGFVLAAPGWEPGSTRAGR